MHKFAALLVAGLFAALTASAAMAQERPADFRARNANIFSGPGGQALTLPSQASPPAVIMEFLRGEGYVSATVSSLVLEGENRVQRTGLTHFRFRQQVGGLTVHGAYVKATVNSDGQLVHLIEALAWAGGGVQPTLVGPRDALDAALAENYPDIVVTVREAGHSGNTVTFAGDDFFYRNPTVTRIAVAIEGDSLQEGFLVETWSEAGNMLHHTLVGPSGHVLKVELRTNNDSYYIFPDHPGNHTQTVMPGPGAGNTESPIGWLLGSQNTINIGGNNVNAYLDTDRNNAQDAGGSQVDDGNFLAQADLTRQPYTAENQAVAVQNLFYFNNLIHDKLYRHGFNETAGNFQNENFGLGGLGADSVNAEAQDGSGTDNANFSTPPDGSNPRMQMFLWSGSGDHLVVFPDNSVFIAEGADFGISLFNNPLNGDVVAALDGMGSTTDGCEPLTNNPEEITGKIALVDRGNCRFDTKVKNAQVAGAVGVIIANNQGDDLVSMTGNNDVDGVAIKVPVVFIGQRDGASLRASLPQHAKLMFSGYVYRDGDVDSDIIYHEYGHGLTWRMIGDMSGVMSGAIGEGMSDVLAILMNNDDVVAEYSKSNLLGIRSAPYTDYPRTYGDFTGASVHFDGEIYAATIWRLWELFQANGISQDVLFDYLIGGNEFTPAGPAFEDMRDGIVQAASTAGNGHECLVWEAFAQFGVGSGAQYVDGVVTPSADLPPACSGSLPALDAAIASIGVLTLPVVDGVANTVSVRVSNAGTGRTAPLSVILTDDGDAVGELKVAEIQPGESTDLEFGWTPSGAGIHVLVARHDLADTADDGNDSATLTVTVLFQHNVAVLWVGAPERVGLDAVVPVSVGVENMGAFNESFNVTLSDDADGAVIGKQWLTDLTPGTTETLNFDWDTAGASLGGHTLTATADQVASETYMADNSAQASSEVTEPVISPSVSYISPREMDAVDSPANVMIVGSGFGADPKDVTVTFIDGRGRAPVATVEAVSDTEIHMTVSAKANGRKGKYLWNLVVTTSNGSDILYSAFIVNR